MIISDRVAADIRARIKAGDLKPGDRLPTVPELQAAYAHLGDDGVISEMPVRQALRDLRAEGLVRSVHGKGNYVAEPTPT